ncbi:heme-binding protein, partial [Streptomyces gardneri]
MKKLSLRTRVLTGTIAATALAAGTFGAVSANAATPAAAPAAADAKNKNTMESTHLTIEAATKAAQATLDAAEKENQRVSVAV